MNAPPGFWKKVKRVAGKVPFADHAVALWFCMRDPLTPLWAKVQIAGALAYFVSPIDAIPDAVPVLGYVDDAGVVMGTFEIVAIHVTTAHLERARRWFDA